MQEPLKPKKPAIYRQDGQICFGFEQNQLIEVLIKIHQTNALKNKPKPRLTYQFRERNGYEWQSVQYHLSSRFLSRFTYKFNNQFYEFTKKGEEQLNSQQIFDYFQTKYKSFTYQKHILKLSGFRVTQIQPLYEEILPPIQLFFQGIAAAKIIKLIQSGCYENIEQKIQNFWNSKEKKFDINTFNISEQIKLTNQTLQRLFLAQKLAKKRLIGMFSFWANYSDPYHLDHKIFNQERFIDASPYQDRFVYHITNTTQQIFKNMKITQNQQCKKGKKHLFIHGLGGIGKSVSASLLVVLHNFIDKLRTTSPVNNCDVLEDKQMKWSQINQYPKYFYYSLSAKQNLKKFNQTIRRQLPYDLTIQMIQDERLTGIIDDYYKDKCKNIYIIDQINILCKLGRLILEKSTEYNKGEYTEIHFYQTQNLIMDLRQSLVVFSSSQNAQFSLISKITRNLSLMSNKKIAYQKKNCNNEGITKIFQMVRFQFFNQSYSRENMQTINKNIKNFEKINQNLLKENDYTVVNFLLDLTHLRVKLSLKKILRQGRFELEQDDYVQFFRKIHSHSLKLLKERYKLFIQKGNELQRRKKIKRLSQLRATAIKWYENQKNNKNQAYFQHKSETQDFQSEQLFKEHAQITENNTIQVYLLPMTFLLITDFILKEASLNLKYAEQLLAMYLRDPTILGRLYDITYTQVFSQHKLIIRIQNTFYIQHLIKPYASFVGFGSILTSSQIQNYKVNKQNCKIDSKTSIYTRFSKIFHLFDSIRFNNPIDNQYICAIPTKFNEQNNPYSQCIDFLLIKHNIEASKRNQNIDKQQKSYKYLDQYTLCTYDFCVSFDKQYITKKIKNAELFFVKFIYIQQLQNKDKQKQKQVNKLIQKLNKQYKTDYPTKKNNYRFQTIQHTFIVPNKMVKIFSEYKQSIPSAVTFKFSPIEEILYINMQKDSSINENLQNTLLALKNKLKEVENKQQ